MKVTPYFTNKKGKQVERVVTLPWIGNENTQIIKSAFEGLGLNIKLPPQTTKDTISKGVKYSADMMCFPYKVVLGNFMEAIASGANTLLMYDSQGTCRERHYYMLQKHMLDELGLDFEMFGLNYKNMISILSQLSGKSRLTVAKVMRNAYHKMQASDKARYNWSDEKPNIGIIGEISICSDERVNHNLEKKIKLLEANPYNLVTPGMFIHEELLNMLHLSIFNEKKKYMKQVAPLLNGPVGGHGFENLYNLAWLIDKGVDGVVHAFPLACTPEVTVELLVERMCAEAKIPFLKVVIDETYSEANLDTRLETFIYLADLAKKGKIK